MEHPEPEAEPAPPARWLPLLLIVGALLAAGLLCSDALDRLAPDTNQAEPVVQPGIALIVESDPAPTTRPADRVPVIDPVVDPVVEPVTPQAEPAPPVVETAASDPGPAGPAVREDAPHPNGNTNPNANPNGHTNNGVTGAGQANGHGQGGRP